MFTTRIRYVGSVVETIDQGCMFKLEGSSMVGI